LQERALCNRNLTKTNFNNKRRNKMPKYLAHASYTVEGLKGLLKDGGTKRREAVEQLAKGLGGLGGTVEAFYYAFGDDDLFVIFDLPDNVSATIGSMVVNASGAAKAKMTVLLTPEEVDEATKKSVDYIPPGQ
jgi:uncharacterized protein with GYD domain